MKISKRVLAGISAFALATTGAALQPAIAGELGLPSVQTRVEQSAEYPAALLPVEVTPAPEYSEYSYVGYEEYYYEDGNQYYALENPGEAETSPDYEENSYAPGDAGDDEGASNDDGNIIGEYDGADNDFYQNGDNGLDDEALDEEDEDVLAPAPDADLEADNDEEIDDEQTVVDIESGSPYGALHPWGVLPENFALMGIVPAIANDGCLQFQKQAGAMIDGVCTMGVQLDTAGFLWISQGNGACWKYTITNTCASGCVDNVHLSDSFQGVTPVGTDGSQATVTPSDKTACQGAGNWFECSQFQLCAGESVEIVLSGDVPGAGNATYAPCGGDPVTGEGGSFSGNPFTNQEGSDGSDGSWGFGLNPGGTGNWPCGDGSWIYNHATVTADGGLQLDEWQAIGVGDIPAGIDPNPPTVEYGEVDVTKVVDLGNNPWGLSADSLGPFTVNISCTLDGAQVAIPDPPGASQQVSNGQTVTWPNLPPGAICTLSETGLPPAWSSSFSVNPVTVPPNGTVTSIVTNTLDNTGDLNITKLLSGNPTDDDENYPYQVNVSCTYQGQPLTISNPVTIYASADGTPSYTIPGLPAGAICSVTETDPGTADQIGITPPQVTIPSGDSSNVLVLNWFGAGAGQVDVQKDISSILAANSNLTLSDLQNVTFTATISCVDGEGNAVEPQGSPDRVLTYPDFSASWAPIPVLPTTCAITEVSATPDGAWNFISADPSSVDVCDLADDGCTASLVTLTNELNTGDLQLTKETSGLGALYFADTQYTVNVVCNWNGTPLAEFNPYTTTLTVGQPLTIEGLPAGAQCTVSEPDNQNADAVTVCNDAIDSPCIPLAQIGDGTTSGLTVTNIYGVADVNTRKVFELGANPWGLCSPNSLTRPPTSCAFGQDDLAGFSFDVTISCTDADGTLVTAPPAVTQTITSANGWQVAWGPLPPGVQCTVEEADPGQPWTQGDVTPDPVTVCTPTVAGMICTSQVQAANILNTGDMNVTKTVVDPGGFHEGLVYQAHVTCTFNGQTLVDDTYDIEDGDSLPFDDLPVGTVCSVTETQAQGAVGTVTNSPITITEAGPNTVAITNEFFVGNVILDKTVTSNSLVSFAGATFEVQISCTDAAGNSIDLEAHGIDPEQTLTYPDGLSTSWDGLPKGATCTFEEISSDPPGFTATFDPTSVTVCPTLNGSQTCDDVSVSLTNTLNEGGLAVTKQVTGPGAAFHQDNVFEVNVSCTWNGQTLQLSNPYEISVDSPLSIPGLPVGAQCTVTETEDNNADLVTITPTQPVTVVADGTVSVQVENWFDAGNLQIDKVVSGPGAGFHQNETFTVHVACTLNGQSLTLPNSGNYSVTPGQPLSIPGLPSGAVCTVTEPSSNANQTTITPSGPVTIGQGTTVNVGVNNWFVAGTVGVTKSLVLPPPLTASDLAGTQFTVTISCTLNGQNVTPPNPTQTITVNPDGTMNSPSWTPIPQGASCTLTEGDTGGAWVGVFTPSTVSPVCDTPTTDAEGNPVCALDQVGLVNTLNTANLEIRKYLAGQGIPIDRPLQIEVNVTCEFNGVTIPVTNPQTITILDGSTSASVNIPGLPVGTVCTVDEPSPTPPPDLIQMSPTNCPGADMYACSVATIPPAGGLVRIVNWYGPYGELTVQKTFPDPLPWGLTDDIINNSLFTFNLSCDDPAFIAPVNPTVLWSGNQFTATWSPLEIGDNCEISEAPAPGSIWVPDQNPVSATVCDPADTSCVSTVPFQNNLRAGSLQITKTVTGTGANAHLGDSFVVDTSCSWPSQSIANITMPTPVVQPGGAPAQAAPGGGWVIQHGQTLSFPSLPAGAVCTVTEPGTSGATSTSVTPSTVNIAESSTASVAVVNTFVAPPPVVTPPTAPPAPPNPSNPSTPHPVTGVAIASLLMAGWLTLTGLFFIGGSRRRRT